MFKRRNSLVSNKRYKIIIIIILSILFIISFFLVISYTNLFSLMGNTVTQYYCNDSSYTLQGDNCVRITKEGYALLGDVSLDNKITEDDLNILSSYADLVFTGDENSANLSDLQIKVADIDQDGEISYIDSTILSEYLSGIINTYYAYTDDIGIKRLCSDGFKLNSDTCIKKEVTKASSKELEAVDLTVTDDNNTNIDKGDIFGIKYNFNINDVNNNYYYKTYVYKYDKPIGVASCKQIQNGTFWKKFTMDGNTRMSVKIYTDSSCNNEEKSVDSKLYKCTNCTNGIDVDFKTQNDIFYGEKNTNLDVKVIFNKIDNDSDYYYKISNYYNGDVTDTTTCKKINSSELNNTIKLDGYRKMLVAVYRDSSCKNKINDFYSRTYIYNGFSNGYNSNYKFSKNDTNMPIIRPIKAEVTNVQNNSVITDYKFTNKNYLPNNTKLTFKIDFLTFDTSRDYYYKWNSETLGAEGCKKIPKSGTINITNIIKTNNLNPYLPGNYYNIYKGYVYTFADSSCTKLLQYDKTKDFRYQYFKVKYDKNGGVIDNNSEVVKIYNLKNTFDFSRYGEADTSWMRIYRDGYDLVGFKVKNSKGQFACYTNAKKTEKGYRSESICKKYGYVIYKTTDRLVRTTSTDGDTLTFIAQWTKKPVRISVGIPINNSYRYKTKVSIPITFNVEDRENTYYYRWFYYKTDTLFSGPNGEKNRYEDIRKHVIRFNGYYYGEPYTESYGGGGISSSAALNVGNSCTKITDNKKYTPTLTIGKSINFGVIFVYKDKDCKHMVGSIKDVYKLMVYKCSNCRG